MINVSNEFKEKMEESRDFIYTGEITFADGTQMTLDHDDLNLSGSGITMSSGSSAFPIGSAICRKLSLALYNDDDRYDGISFAGAVIRMTLSFELSSTTEDIDLGTFTVTEPETYGSTVSVTAYDGFYKADIPFSAAGLTFPISARALFVACCYACQLSPQTPRFANDDYVIQKAPENMSFRQVIGLIAMLAGANAVCINDGVRIVPYDADGFSNNRYHLLTEHYNPTIDTDQVVITGVQTKAGNDVILVGVEGYVLEITNPLIERNEAAAVQGIGDVLIGLSLRPFEADLVSYPLAEIGDACIIEDYKGNQYQAFVTDIDFGFSSYTKISCTAESAVRNASTGYSSAAQIRASQAGRAAAQAEVSAYDTEMQRLVELMTNSAGAYYTEEEDPNGGRIFYMHDKPTLEESENIWKRTADGFVVSVDGGSTWTSGWDAHGNVVLNILSAIGINADWLNAGAITIRNAGGDVIFQADITNRSIYMTGDNVFIGNQTATEAIAQATGLLTIALTNETQAIPVDSAGDYAVFPSVETEIRVFHGHDNVTALATLTASPANITGSLTDHGSYYVYTPTSLTEDSGYALFNATYTDSGQTLTTAKRFNLFKAYAGATGARGEPGSDGRLYFIESNVTVFKVGLDDAFNPASVTYSAFYRDGSGVQRTPYYGRFFVDITRDGINWETVINPVENVFSVTYTPTDPTITSVRCRLYSAADFDTYYYGFATDESGENLLVDTDGSVLLLGTEMIPVSQTNQLDVETTAVVMDISALSQEDVFNLLTNNGEARGIFFLGNQLYVNMDYLSSGIVATGILKNRNNNNNYWNLDTGEFRIGPSTSLNGEAVSALQSRVSVNTGNISAEVQRATGAESSLGARLTLTERSLESKITSADAESLIQQSASSIRLQASRLSWSSNNSALSADGVFTSMYNGHVETTISQGMIVLSTLDNNLESVDCGVIHSQYRKDNTGGGEGYGVEIFSGGDANYLVLGVRGSSVNYHWPQTRILMINDGYNPNGYTENVIIFGRLRVTGNVVSQGSATISGGASVGSNLTVGGTTISLPHTELKELAYQGDVYAFRINRYLIVGDGTWFSNYMMYIKGNLYVSGTVTQSSDERKKTILPWDDRIDELVRRVEPILYSWKDGEDKKLHVGLGAQSTERLLDELGLENQSFVVHSENDEYGINYTELAPMMLSTLQKACDRIDELEAKVAEQEARLARLESLLEGKE